MIFLIPIETYSQYNSSVNVDKNNSVTDGFVPIDGFIKIDFDEEFYAKVNRKSDIKYMRVTFNSYYNEGYTEINRNQLLTYNKDTNFFFSKELPIYGYNSNEKVIFESSEWESLELYSEHIDDEKKISILDIPFYFKPSNKGDFSGMLIVYPSGGSGPNYIDPGFLELKGTGYIPEIKISNFTFESHKINSGVSKQKGTLKIHSDSITVDMYQNRPYISIRSLKIDPNSPDKELFTSFRFLNSEFEFDKISGKRIETGLSLDVEFELNTDMATTTGTKFARLVVESDAAPALESGYPQTVENSYQHEFDGDYYMDNPTALSDGGYIQVEILENPQSSVEELADSDIKILNPQPITGSELNLEINEYNGAVITLSEIEGNVIQSLQANKKQVSIDVSNLTTGVYFINISDGKSQITKKFMIER